MTDLEYGGRTVRNQGQMLRYYAAKESDPAFVAKHRERCREAQRKRRRKPGVRAIEAERMKAARLENVIPFLLRAARARAKVRGLPYDLTLAWAAEHYTGKCAVTGIPFEQQTVKQGSRSPSLDRIKPELGYVVGNCRFILSAVNSLKGASSDEEMLLIAKAMVNPWQT